MKTQKRTKASLICFSSICGVLVIAFLFIYFGSAIKIRKTVTENQAKALEYIEQENYADAYDILYEDIGYLNNSEILKTIVTPAFDQKIMRALPNCDYEARCEKLKGLSDSELSRKLYLQYTNEEADRLYGLGEYKNALILYLQSIDYKYESAKIEICIRNAFPDITLNIKNN